MMGTFNPFEANYDTINDKDDFNISNVSKNYTIDPLETEAERNIRTRTAYADVFFFFSNEIFEMKFCFSTPIVTGSSIAAFVFKDGVILAADVLGSYGSLAKYRNLPRIHQVNDQTVLAVSGDLSDADYIKEAIDTKVYAD